MSLYFGQLLTAMVTPFRPDLSMDFDTAGELAVAIIESGSDGVVVAGTTGESATLNMQEHGELFRVVREAVGRKGLVIAGAGANSTAECLELCHYAEDAGCDGLLLVAPYYNKPSQEGLYQHFRHVADNTGLPILLYNIPGRCSVNITAATTARLAEIPSIIGIKEASGDMEQVADIIQRTGGEFDVYSGDDSATLPILALGGLGVVSVAGHLVGRQIKQMIGQFLGGDVAGAAAANAKLFRFFRSLFVTTNPVPVKAALKMCGWDCGDVRLPLVGASESDLEAIRAGLDTLEAGVDLGPRST